MVSLIAYTYYNNPWRMESGDDVRVHTILSSLAKTHRVVVFNLSGLVEKRSVNLYDNVVYVSLPRRLYGFISRLFKWSRHYDLNPLIKLTHYFDELLVAVVLSREIKRARVLVVFGPRSLFSFTIRLLGAKRTTIIYDPLANYAQTLYLKSRKNPLSLLKYGLYLALHKLEVRASDIVIYPSRVDSENAGRMFKPKKTIIMPNPPPVCYNSLEEYLELRSQRIDYTKPYFILLAGGRGKINEEAIKLTINVFNNFPPEKFKLIITGPWQDMKKYVKNQSIELLGVVPREKLKELLAIADYGLSPIFTHAAGTFLKTLAYISAGLNIIASPYGVIGLDINSKIKVYLARNKHEYANIITKIIHNTKTKDITSKSHSIILCKDLSSKIESIISYIKNNINTKYVK